MAKVPLLVLCVTAAAVCGCASSGTILPATEQDEGLDWSYDGNTASVKGTFTALVEDQEARPLQLEADPQFDGRGSYSEHFTTYEDRTLRFYVKRWFREFPAEFILGSVDVNPSWADALDAGERVRVPAARPCPR